MRLEYAYITPLEVIPMKTRAEIYGNEAAALLRIVTMSVSYTHLDVYKRQVKVSVATSNAY